MTRTLTRNAGVWRDGGAQGAAIRGLARFRNSTGNFYGYPIDHHGYIGTGRMPEPYASWLNADEKWPVGIDYVVGSYATPIAWHTRDGRWTVPPVSYSPTTAKHQHQVRLALGVDYDDAWPRDQKARRLT